MKFRPCIDIHNGKVKQLVGGSLKDKGNKAKENFVSEKNADYFAQLYKSDGLKGGHIIILNNKDSEYFNDSKNQALKALSAYPGGMQIGGGINSENAKEFINAGATHVIVTSYVFKNGKIDFERLDELARAVGKEHIVLDLSCRKKDNKYYIVTDRWQKFTDVYIDGKTLDMLADFCDEFLIHGVDSEGKSGGMEYDLVKILSNWNKIPVTYAGGIAGVDQLEELRNISKGNMDFTIGSALDLFGGTLKYNEIKTIK